VPPLDIGAMIVAFYVAIRVATQFGNLASAALFRNQALKATRAIGALVLIRLSIFVERLAGRWSADKRAGGRIGVYTPSVTCDLDWNWANRKRAAGCVIVCGALGESPPAGAPLVARRQIPRWHRRTAGP